MKKLFALILICALAALMLAACGDNAEAPASSATESGTAETAAPTEAPASGSGMTETYAAGRQAYYDITGIWMPEAAGFEAEHEANYEHKSIVFDSHGDRALYEAARAALVEALGEPTGGDENSAYWSIPSADGKTTANYDVIYYTEDGEWVFMNYHVETNEA